MSRYHDDWLALALALVLAGGCRDDNSETADPATAAREDGVPCVDFHGLRHCPLGNATLTSHADRSVELADLRDADRDGVTVQLPDVTSFAPVGRVDLTAPGSRTTARAMSGGHTIGTMSMQRTSEGYRVAAAFTGEGNEGTYRIRLFRGEALVGTIGHIPNGDPVLLPRGMSPAHANWLLLQHQIVFWSEIYGLYGLTAGECVFAVPFEVGDELLVLSDEGNVVIADRIELREDVLRGGSYPYMTFDRMDYTVGNGRMLLLGASIENRE